MRPVERDKGFRGWSRLALGVGLCLLLAGCRSGGTSPEPMFIDYGGDDGAGIIALKTLGNLVLVPASMFLWFVAALVSARK
jgi:hypothetical protein